MAMEMLKPSSLELNSEDLPAIKDWKVGQSYKLQLDVRMIESELEENDKICAEFEIKKATVL